MGRLKAPWLPAQLGPDVMALTQRIKDADRDIDSFLHTNELWRKNEALLRSTPGVGKTTAATLIAFLLSIQEGAKPTAPLVAAGLALVAGICSVARLNPAIRSPRTGEERELQPASQLR